MPRTIPITAAATTTIAKTNTNPTPRWAASDTLAANVLVEGVSAANPIMVFMVAERAGCITYLSITIHRVTRIHLPTSFCVAPDSLLAVHAKLFRPQGEYFSSLLGCASTLGTRGSHMRTLPTSMGMTLPTCIRLRASLCQGLRQSRLAPRPCSLAFLGRQRWVVLLFRVQHGARLGGLRSWLGCGL